MSAAGDGRVKSVTTPNLSGDFWADMANPHNIGIMWQDENGVWKQLEEYEEPAPEGETKDEKWERERKSKNKKYLDDNPGLREDLQKLLDKGLELEKFASDINKKYKKDHNKESNYNFNQKLDYATEGGPNSIINQFGFYDNNDLNEYGDPTQKLL